MTVIPVIANLCAKTRSEIALSTIAPAGRGDMLRILYLPVVKPGIYDVYLISIFYIRYFVRLILGYGYSIFLLFNLGHMMYFSYLFLTSGTLSD